jgi:hypothetical protein
MRSRSFCHQADEPGAPHNYANTSAVAKVGAAASLAARIGDMPVGHGSRSSGSSHLMVRSAAGGDEEGGHALLATNHAGYSFNRQTPIKDRNPDLDMLQS